MPGQARIDLQRPPGAVLFHQFAKNLDRELLPCFSGRTNSDRAPAWASSSRDMGTLTITGAENRAAAMVGLSPSPVKVNRWTGSVSSVDALLAALRILALQRHRQHLAAGATHKPMRMGICSGLCPAGRVSAASPG
ncbi:MAG: hypothetical protein R3D03_14380 [Geminicoccaceae bacterium]